MRDEELKELRRQTRMMAEKRAGEYAIAGLLVGIGAAVGLAYWWPDLDLPTWAWLAIPPAFAVWSYWMSYREMTTDRGEGSRLSRSIASGVRKAILAVLFGRRG